MVGSTSARRVRLRAASSISCELCSALSKEICNTTATVSPDQIGQYSNGDCDALADLQGVCAAR